MPIKGLTDREAAFPQIGILRKGDAKKGNCPGADLKHFRFTSEHEDVSAAFENHYGSEPVDVNIHLPYRTAGENFHAWREHWVAGGLKHRCDGETCTVIQQEDGSYSTEPQPCPGKCKPVGRLSVIIPELKRLAFVTALTTSVHDILTITENLTALEMISGDLRGIPLILRRRPRKVSTPTPQGKRVRREIWLLTVEAAPTWVAFQLAAQQAAAIPRLADGSLPELTAPEDDNGAVIDAETGEIIETVGEATTGDNGPDYADGQPEWFEEAPAAEPEPPAEKPNGGPARLLAAVNAKCDDYYQHVNHMAKAVQKQVPTFAGWPPPDARDDWNKLFRILVSYAQQKQIAESKAVNQAAQAELEMAAQF